ncbi:hypothetical protein ACFC26_23925 [Kitasatospora purpeofusca]|uniref:NHL domain-containing protein n=1 Tax=Kitasatospora purpeofusca TaxID=67352 RepID=UPI0035E2D5C0
MVSLPSGQILTPGYIGLFAGTGNATGDLGDGKRADLASLDAPRGLTLGRGGVLFIADTGHHRVRMVDSTGVITTYAGTGEPGADPDGTDAAHARLKAPTGLVAGPDGSLYIADSDANVVYRVTPQRTIERFAGAGEGSGNGKDGDPARTVRLEDPDRLAMDAWGNLYIWERGRYTVRKVDTGGIVTTYAGNGDQGDDPTRGEGSRAVDVCLHGFWVRQMAVDGDGVLYLAGAYTPKGTSSEEILTRRVDRQGIITTRKQDSFNAVAFGRDGTRYALTEWYQLTMAPAGSPVEGVVLRTTGVPAKDEFSGAPVPARDTKLFVYWYAAFDGSAAGDLYILDYERHRVLVVAQARVAAVTSVQVTEVAAVPGAVPAGKSAAVDFTWKAVLSGVAKPVGTNTVVTLPAGTKVTSYEPVKEDGTRWVEVVTGADATTVTWRWWQPPAETAYRVTAELPVAEDDKDRLVWIAVGHDAPDPGWTSKPATVTRTVTIASVGSGALSVSNTQVEPPVVAADGSTAKGVVFSWDVGREGGGSLAGVKVSAQLPAGVKVAGAIVPKPDNANANPLTWTLTGTEAIRHFTVTTDVTAAPHAGDLPVRVTATPTSGKEAWAPVVLHTSTPGPLAVTGGEAFPEWVKSGSTVKGVVFSWDVGREGGGSLQGVKVSAQLPAGVKVAGAVVPKPDNADANPLTWTLTGQDAARHFTVATDVTPGAGAAEERVQVTAAPASGQAVSGGAAVQVVAAGGVALTGASVRPSSVAGGSTVKGVVFSWDVEREGGGSLEWTKVSAQLPAGVKVTGEVVPKPDDVNANPLTWTLTGKGAVQHFTVTTDVTLAAGAEATAVLKASLPSGITSTGSATVHATGTTVPVAGEVKVVGQGVVPSWVKAGTTTKGVRFSWDVQAVGGGSLKGVKVSAQLPAEVKAVKVDPQPDDLKASPLAWTLGEGTSRHFTLTADVTAADTAHSDVVRVTAQPTGSTKPDTEDITLDVVSKEQPAAGAVTVSDGRVSPSRVDGGSTTKGVVFAWTVGKEGGGSLKGVTVTGTLPEQAAVVSYKPDGATVTGRSVVWTLPETAAPAGFSITGDVTPGKSDKSCTAAVSAKPVSGVTDTKEITLDVDLRAEPANGTVTVADTGVVPAPVDGGSTTKGVVFSWTVRREGGGSLKGVTVTGTLPEQAAVVSYKPDGATVTGRSVVWTLPETAAPAGFSITGDVTPGKSDKSCTAAVSAKPVSGVTDTKEITLSVDPKSEPSKPAVLAVPSWRAFPAQAGRGGHVALAWKVVNHGQGTADGVKATVTLPKGLSPIGAFKDTAGVWDEKTRTLTSNQGGTLKPGAYWWITVAAAVDADAPVGDLEVPATVTAGAVTTPPTVARVSVKDTGDKPLVWTLGPDDIKGLFLTMGALPDPDKPGMLVGGGVGGGPYGGIVPGIGITTLVSGLVSLFGIFSWLFSIVGILAFWGGWGGWGGGPEGDPGPDQPENEEPDKDEKKNRITHLWFTQATLSPAKASPGQSVTLTWELSNTGEEDATSVGIQIRLPDTLDLTDVKGEGTWSKAAGFAYGSLGTLKKAAKTKITVTAKVRAGASATKSATASAMGGHATPATSSIQVPVQAPGALQLSKGQTAPQPAQPEQDVTFTWTVSATAGQSARNTTITLVPPVSGLDSPKLTVDGKDVPLTKPVLTLDRDLSSADAPVQVVLKGKIAKGRTADVSASVSATAEGMTAPVTDTATAVIKAKGTGLRVTGTLMPAQVVAGLGATYVWSLSNDGTSDLSGVALTAQLPPAGTVTNVRPARGGKATTTTVTWDTNTVGTLKAGTTWIASVGVDILPDATATLPAVTATATGEGGAKDTSNPVTAPVTTLTQLALAASASPTKAKAGATTTFTFSITATGPSTHTGATLTVQLDAGLKPTKVTVNGTKQAAPQGSTVTVQLPATPRNPDKAVTVALTTTVDAGATGTKYACATLTTGGHQAAVPTAKAAVQVGSETAPTSLTPRPAGPKHIAAGTTGDLSWTAVNGTATAETSATLALTVPEKLTVQQVTVDGTVTDLATAGSTVTATLGKLPTHTDMQVTATVHAAADATGTGDVSAVLTVPPNGDAKATTTVRFDAAVNLKTKAQHVPDPARAGQEVIWQWIVANDGRSTYPGRTLTATASKDLTPLKADPNGSVDGKTITWTALSALQPGQAWNLTALATLDAKATTEPTITLNNL